MHPVNETALAIVYYWYTFRILDSCIRILSAFRTRVTPLTHVFVGQIFFTKALTNTLQSSTLSSHVAICTVNPFLHLYLSCIEQRQTVYISQHTMLCIILTWRIDSNTILVLLSRFLTMKILCMVLPIRGPVW